MSDSLSLPDGLELRLAQPEEYEAVGEALIDAFTHGCWITDAYRERLRSISTWAKTSHVWVVASGPGAIHATVTTPRPEMWHEEAFTFNVLGVARSGRGHGLGSILVRHCLGLAHDYGYSRIELHSSPHMTHAHQLYYSFGFHRRIDQETMVIDSGQRLFAFSRDVSWREPLFIHESSIGRNPVTSEPSVFDELVSSPRDLRAWPARIGAALLGITLTDDLNATPDALEGPRLINAGKPVSTQWGETARLLWDELRGAPRDADEEWLVRTIDEDILAGALRIAADPTSVSSEADRRVLYARLGWLDHLLASQRFIGGETLSEADGHLFGFLLTFDIGLRNRFPFADAAVVDYPNLWRYARELSHHPGLVSDAAFADVGLAADTTGNYLAPWGDPAWTETVADLRAAWNIPASIAS